MKLVFLAISLVILAMTEAGLDRMKRHTHQGGKTTPQWSYDGELGPYRWGEYYPSCNGWRQSPIDLSGFDQQWFDRQEFQLTPDWADAGGDTWSLRNSGHSVQVDLGYGYNVSGGGLENNRRYSAKQFHFHWVQSEHRVDGMAFPMEMHIVAEDVMMGDQASTSDKGLAVLAFFFQQVPFDNQALAPITGNLKNLVKKGQKINLTSFDLTQLIADAMYGRYWRYSGSLTTPPCSESVVWTVFENRIPISAAQLELFTKIKTAEGHPILANSRPIQQRNGREVYVM